MYTFDSDIDYNFINTPTFNELYILVFGHEACAPDKSPQGFRQKNFYVLHYILSGKGTLCINNETYSLAAGDVFLVPPNTECIYCQDKDDPWSYVWFEFTGAKAKVFCDNAFLTLETPFCHCPNERIVQNLVALFEKKEHPYTAALSSLAYLMLLFAEVTAMRNPAAQEKLVPKERIVNMAQSYINRNYANPELSLTAISKALYLNSSYLSRIFKEYTGINISRFIISVRMQHARRLLEEGELSINEVAAQTGYSDYHYFTVQFKKHVGISPSGYKRGLPI